MTATLQADGDFGDVKVGEGKLLNLEVLNQSDVCLLEVTSFARLVGTTEFTFAGLASGLTFPVTLATGSNLDLPIRFQPSDFGPETATFRLTTDDSAHSPLDFGVTGDSPPPEITVSGNLQFGEVCAENLAEKTVEVCNEAGVNNLSVNASLVGACGDFAIQGNPFPADLSPDFCVPVTVRYTPTAVGDHDTCDLVITNNDPDENPVTIPLNGTTPAPVIDVTGDQGFPQTVIQSIGACSSSQLFPVQNNGQCQLDVTDISITDNAAEYSLDGLPSFPIKLQGGELAGDGSLSTVFARQTLARTTTGKVSVTYLSDPIVGTTATITRELCGEAVHTGARVLVTQGGTPLAKVDRIQFQRINANRNRPHLDTVDNSRNLPLQTVLPSGACAGFRYHKEYGTVSNPIQLLPGSYQVTVQTKINGKNQRKTVGFDVDTCGFNPTITVDF